MDVKRWLMLFLGGCMALLIIMLVALPIALAVMAVGVGR